MIIIFQGGPASAFPLTQTLLNIYGRRSASPDVPVDHSQVCKFMSFIISLHKKKKPYRPRIVLPSTKQLLWVDSLRRQCRTPTYLPRTRGGIPALSLWLSTSVTYHAHERFLSHQSEIIFPSGENWDTERSLSGVNIIFYIMVGYFRGFLTGFLPELSYA